MPNMPQYLDSHATRATSQPAVGLRRFLPQGIRVIPQPPKDSVGKLVVDRQLLDLDASRKMSRGPYDEHPLFMASSPATVLFETAEHASPRVPGSYKNLNRAQEPVQYEETRARMAGQLACGRRAIDIKDLLSTTALWGVGTSSTLVALGGSGVKITDYVNSDVITDASIAIGNYMALNGYHRPTHWHFSLADLLHMQRHEKLQAAVASTSYSREDPGSIVEHLQSVLKIEVVIHDETNANALIWPDSWVFTSDPPQPSVIMNDGAEIPPMTAALLTEEVDGVQNDLGFYLKRYDSEDGNVFNYAAVASYDVAQVDSLAIYIVTDTE